MKYFFFLFLIILAIGALIARNNTEHLSDADVAEETVFTKQRYQKIQLKKISYKDSEEKVADEGSADDERREITSISGDEIPEINVDLDDSKFSGEAHLKYQPEMPSRMEEVMREYGR